jgi:predicted oxidoreductase
LLKALDEAARTYATERTVIALAWLLRHPSGIVPVVGSANPERIRTAARAAEIEMDRETWYRILLPARGEKLP